MGERQHVLVFYVLNVCLILFLLVLNKVEYFLVSFVLRVQNIFDVLKKGAFSHHHDVLGLGVDLVQQLSLLRRVAKSIVVDC